MDFPAGIVCFSFDVEKEKIAFVKDPCILDNGQSEHYNYTVCCITR